MSRRRDWCFTLNNPTGWDDAEIDTLKGESSYLVFGKEVGENGTPHYQGYVQFTNPRRLSALQRVLTRAHWEPRKGTPVQAADYCKKDGDYTEFGEAPVGKRTSNERWKWVIEKAENGELAEIKDKEPATYIRYLSTLRGLNRRGVRILDGPELDNEWWYGNTGTGKSRRLHGDYPDHYQKPLNKWWDGYEDEKVVGLEEVHPGCGGWLGHFLKIWADRYPFTGEIKGGTLKNLRPEKLVVTSNYTIEECFPDPKDHLPLRRRFKVTHFQTFVNTEE